ncbi:hypothetical protein IQ264_09565 [Phormidium sp. LEGE 05292]|uniref:hypothetical protein n=1 Tax=[Phormidium] sp. LEGE 05292 TaxID=767427 RepID=UPI001882B93C|nr:hypothetical protein [Phormidium sp. LEGE 05292]MBE9225668.1 hypothetical protein [Phormidium sp. LEGE 05292]
MKIALISAIAITLNSLVLPIYAQTEPSDRKNAEQSQEELLACTARKDDKNPRLGGWQQLIGRQRSEAESSAYQTGGLFTTVSPTQATIVTKTGEIINISYGQQDQVIKGVCRSRKVEN